MTTSRSRYNTGMGYQQNYRNGSNSMSQYNGYYNTGMGSNYRNNVNQYNTFDSYSPGGYNTGYPYMDNTMGGYGPYEKFRNDTRYGSRYGTRVAPDGLADFTDDKRRAQKNRYYDQGSGYFGSSESATYGAQGRGMNVDSGIGQNRYQDSYWGQTGYRRAGGRSDEPKYNSGYDYGYQP